MRSLPRREPYELNIDTDASVDQLLPAGESVLITPAGEIWSVVTESESLPDSARLRYRIALRRHRQDRRRIVDFECTSRIHPTGTAASLNVNCSPSFEPSKTVAHSVRTDLPHVCTNRGIDLPVSATPESMTGVPSASTPIGSDSRSMSTVPATAYATTNGGEASQLGSNIADTTFSSVPGEQSRPRDRLNGWYLESDPEADQNSDACGATVTDGMEAKRFEPIHQPGRFQVTGHDSGARGKRCLHQGFRRRLRATSF